MASNNMIQKTWKGQRNREYEKLPHGLLHPTASHIFFLFQVTNRIKKFAVRNGLKHITSHITLEHLFFTAAPHKNDFAAKWEQISHKNYSGPCIFKSRDYLNKNHQGINI